MAPRSGRTAAAQTVVEEEEVQDALPRLKFNETLAWRTGRSIPLAELLRRLKELSAELEALEQDEVDRASLVEPAKELASHNLLAHKDKGVKAYTACCLVEMFRLCAPDAPYTAMQLKEIFQLFVVTIIPALADPSSPYNQQHLHVLKSLSEIKSIILLTDIPSADDLIRDVFISCFDVLSGPSKSSNGEELSKNVEHHMTSILGALVDESEGLPPEVIDVVLAQFLRADPRAMSGASAKGKKGAVVDTQQMTQLLKEAPPAYNMAKNICNSFPEKMMRYISGYFSRVLVQVATGGLDLFSDDQGKVSSEEDIQECRKAHNMLRELWRSCPSVVQDIIPTLEQELGTEQIQLRLTATETVGDMISGIGAAGPPPARTRNPSAYPSQSLSSSDGPPGYNFLTTPCSPISFIARHASTYQTFLNRKNDRSPIIRAAWTTAIGRILMTNAGRVGLDYDGEEKIVRYLSEMLIDIDEKVRVSAIKAIEALNFETIIQKLGSHGSCSDEDSVFARAADRVRDRKPNVRKEAVQFLANIWGVGAGAIAEGSERVTNLLGPFPTKILEAYYVDEAELTALIDRSLYEALLPLDYPPIKPKAAQLANGASQNNKEGMRNGTYEEASYSESDINRIRAERELVLIRDLSPKAKAALFVKGDTKNARFMNAFLAECEKYNGGVVVEHDEKTVKQSLTKLIDTYAKMLPDSKRAAEDLWKFAKMHDRRCYMLIRYCISPESDYRRIQKSIKEITARLEDSRKATPTMIYYLTVLIYRASVLLFNRSHVPAIIDFSRSDDKNLGATAHEVLKEISNRNPEVFKVHIQDLCSSLETEAPTKSKTNGPGSVANLKACSGFVKKFPEETPKTRKFLEAMQAYALYGSPPEVAKYAVSVLLAGSDKKELYTKNLLEQCLQGFEYGAEHFMPRLAAMSQLVLVGARAQVDKVYDAVSELAISKVLLRDSPNDTDTTMVDTEWTDKPDQDCATKIWALKLLANRLRSLQDDEQLSAHAKPIYTFLNTLVRDSGQLPGGIAIPKAHQGRIRLAAAQLLLKLSCVSKKFDALLSPPAFNQLCLVSQDHVAQVRDGFIHKITTYLNRKKLSSRFYIPLFLLAFEPTKPLRQHAETFLRSHAAQLKRLKDTTMEGMLARLLSILAHHPDLADEPAEIKDATDYLIFYLRNVANRDNLSLIYHVAQRVKGVRDGIDDSATEPNDITPGSKRLYMMSEFAQTIITEWADQHAWPLESHPTKLKLPAGLFAPLANHEVAQEIAMKQFLPEEVRESIAEQVKAALRSKKRKHEDDGKSSNKRARAADGTAGKVKTAKKARPKKTPRARKVRDVDEVRSSERRRSGRSHVQANYAESSDEDEGDEEMTDAEAGAEAGVETSPGAPSEAIVEEVEREDALSEAPEEESEKEDALSEASEEEVEKEDTPTAPVPKMTRGRIMANRVNSTPRKPTPKPSEKGKGKAKKANSSLPSRKSTRGKKEKEKDIYTMVSSDEDE